MNLRLTLKHINKAFGGRQVLSDVNLTLTAPEIYCIMAPSGAGKTTLLRILMGLTPPDSGEITASAAPCRISAVFQEDRLIEFMTPLENAALVLPGRVPADELFLELSCLLPEESLTRPVSTLSGGMRRRCALLRALLAPSDLLILDEPFTGLDEETKKEAIRCLLEKADGRLVILATHSRQDASLLGAKIIELETPAKAPLPSESPC